MITRPNNNYFGRHFVRLNVVRFRFQDRTQFRSTSTTDELVFPHKQNQPHFGARTSTNTRILRYS
jgi:hypothetical protein